MTQKSIFSPGQRQLLSYAEFNALGTADIFSKLTKQHSANVAYALRRLKDQGVIRKTAVINYTRLGYTNVAMFFSLRTSTSKLHENLRSYLISHPRIAWFGALAGDYQYGMAILVKTMAEFGQFFQDLGNRYSRLFAQKIVAHRSSITLLNKGFLNPKRKERDLIELYSNQVALEIDSTDCKILQALTRQEIESFRDVARSLGLPPSTVERRIDALVANGTIARFIYAVDTGSLGSHWYRLLLFTQGIGPALRKKLHSYALSHPRITMFVESIGAWDFELEAELSSAHDLVTLSQELHDLCDGDLEAIHVLSEIEDYKLNFFPFDIK